MVRRMAVCALQQKEDAVGLTSGALLDRIIERPEECRMVCVSCGRKVRVGDYCTQCGEALDQKLRGVNADICPDSGGIEHRWTLRCDGCDLHLEPSACDMCGNRVASQDNFCNMCGVGFVWRPPALATW
jgi:rRNA maturation endonuclease Nob1